MITSIYQLQTAELVRHWRQPCWNQIAKQDAQVLKTFDDLMHMQYYHLSPYEML